MRGFQKPLWLLSATAIIDPSISDNKSFQLLWFHRTNRALQRFCWISRRKLFSIIFFPWWLKGKKDKRWKQFSSTCSSSYENLVLQNQNWELNLAWHQCYKIDILGTSGQAEKEAGCLSGQERGSRPPQQKKYQLASILPHFPLLCFYSIILQTPDAIQYVIKRQQHA